MRRPFQAAARAAIARSTDSPVRSEPGIHVCKRIPEVTEAVDAMVKRADLN
jgi:hypothetical protein